MKFCEECGAQLEDDATYCDECGARIENFDESEILISPTDTIQATLVQDDQPQESQLQEILQHENQVKESQPQEILQHENQAQESKPQESQLQLTKAQLNQPKEDRSSEIPATTSATSGKNNKKKMLLIIIGIVAIVLLIAIILTVILVTRHVRNKTSESRPINSEIATSEDIYTGAKEDELEKKHTMDTDNDQVETTDGADEIDYSYLESYINLINMVSDPPSEMGEEDLEEYYKNIYKEWLDGEGFSDIIANDDGTCSILWEGQYYTEEEFKKLLYGDNSSELDDGNMELYYDAVRSFSIWLSEDYKFDFIDLDDDSIKELLIQDDMTFYVFTIADEEVVRTFEFDGDDYFFAGSLKYYLGRSKTLDKEVLFLGGEMVQVIAESYDAYVLDGIELTSVLDIMFYIDYEGDYMLSCTEEYQDVWGLEGDGWGYARAYLTEEQFNSFIEEFENLRALELTLDKSNLQ